MSVLDVLFCSFTAACGNGRMVADYFSVPVGTFFVNSSHRLESGLKGREISQRSTHARGCTLITSACSRLWLDTLNTAQIDSIVRLRMSEASAYFYGR
jgi:hypothetical protein